jgi:hypothetical protein
MTRDEYLKNVLSRIKGSHQQYYGQYVTADVIRLVRRAFGKRIVQSKHPYFSDIPLEEWDRVVLPPLPWKKYGDYETTAGRICVLKEAARQIKEEARRAEKS